MKVPSSAAVCGVAGQLSAHTHHPIPTADRGVEDPRDDRGDRRLSDPLDAVGVLTGPTSREPDDGNSARQEQRVEKPKASVVPYGLLKDLVRAQIRRECRRSDFDWEVFVTGSPEWSIVEIVHRRAVRQERGRNLDVRPTDIPTGTVLTAVRDVMAEWDAEPSLRPCEADFRQEQARAW